MRIEKIHLKGFRNFVDKEIFFQKKTLIIGANDVGKSNLLYALRLLFDKNISERDLELDDSDYNVYTKSDSIEITVTITDVVEDCLKSIFVGKVKDGKIIIKYTNTKQSTYKMYWGYSEETLLEMPTRQYIKRLNMEYLDANRNLKAYMNRERNKILQMSKEKRKSEEIEADELRIKNIQTNLNNINSEVSDLNYIASALENVNDELTELSIHNEGQKIKFVSDNSTADEMLNNLSLSYSTETGLLSIGGDGRNNQIFMATWIAKQKVEASIDHVTFFAIEEPEAHLHPHQQRKLSEYIQNKMEDQIFITTHSPQIVSKFDPANIVRLYELHKNTSVACGGCNNYIKSVFENFGYRLNILAAETFFSDGVFLVEGTSEVLFYTAVAKKIGIDLDRLNISILSVEGIGFKPYVAVCEALNIPWVLRTDNDIFKKPTNKPKYKYFAGLSRVMGIISELEINSPKAVEYWNDNKEKNEWENNKSPSEENIKFNKILREKIEESGIYLSEEDLENDLANSKLKPILYKHYGKKAKKSLVKTMQARKAENMRAFLEKNEKSLDILKGEKIMSPLKKLTEEMIGRMKVDKREETD